MGPQKRGEVPDEHAERLRQVRGLVAAAYAERDAAIVAALKAGGSIREVCKLVGLTTQVVSTIGHRGGWPTAVQQAEWDEAKRPAREWNEALRRAEETLRKGTGNLGE